MWCWHRIRETESGLCPACRTPYGEDPHQFSAVDVEEVLKAKKEREAALKRQKQEALQQTAAAALSSLPAGATATAVPTAAAQQQQQQQQISLHSSSLSSGSGNLALSSSSWVDPTLPPAMEVPRDRSQLANMRVIRRNLVYAVGLPANIATEEVLRKPDFFGQYGKIAKIVLNRTAMGSLGGDGRRASASAYVTFYHKEDTLSCILALDGFFYEGRNIRASYGTSKYCSSFIKSVKCNNPECTYLHEMGATEDTFTQQEIKAGYVTSGRDVQARQQQIQEQMLRNGAANSNGARKRVGGGGPSGTGRTSAHPAFPPPEYDEAPPKQQALRQPGLMNPANIAAKLGRSSSVGNKSQPLIPQGTPAVRIKSAAAIVAGSGTSTSTTHAAGAAAKEPELAATREKKSATTSSNGLQHPGSNAKASALGSIGGDVIGLPSTIPRVMQNGMAPTSASVGPSALFIDGSSAVNYNNNNNNPSSHASLSSLLGGEIFTGELHSTTAIGCSRVAIGGGGDHRSDNNDIRNSNAVQDHGAVGGAPLTTTTTSLWNSDVSSPELQQRSIGGDPIGGSNNTSSSALASILGVNLPTGSGSLRETTTTTNNSLWPGQQQQTPLSSLQGSNHTTGSGGGGSSIIGGTPIGGGGSSDMAVLQTLLPGVQITSGMSAEQQQWNSSSVVGGETLQGWTGGINSQQPAQQQRAIGTASPGKAPGIW